MVSNLISMPIVETLQANEMIKDNVLSLIQSNLKKVQNAASHLLSHQKFQGNEIEVQQLCESLFQALSHGLCHVSQSYWEFVKEFTHQKTIEYIQIAQPNKTYVELGWAWLCVALNENCLESYFRSFVQNPHIIKTYYRQPALLRDEQRMEVLITLVAGLEHVPFKLPLASVSNPSSPISLQEVDSGVVDFEHGLEIIVNEEKPICFEESWQNNDSNCNCTDCEKNLTEKRRQIARIINIDTTRVTDSNLQETDVEVIRAKVVRRCRKETRRLFDINKSIMNEKQSDDEDDVENFEKCDDRDISNRFSKLTTDSGLSERCESCDEKSPVSEKKTLFSVSTFHQDLDFKFSTPNIRVKVNSEDSEDDNWLTERGVPEGQEDPEPSIDSSLHKGDIIENTKFEIDAEDDILQDKTFETEDEISIYDLNKSCDNENSASSSCKIPYPETKCIDSVTTSLDSGETSAGTSFDDNESVCTLYADSLNGEALLNNSKYDNSLRPDDNAMLYLTLEIFEEEDEQFYKIFPASFGHLQGIPEVLYVLLTSKFVYFMKPGCKEVRLHKEASIHFSEIDYIYVGLNYQEFLIVCNDHRRTFHIATGDNNLTRSIISNMEVAIRRCKEVISLPCVFTDATAQIIYLKKFLAAEVNWEISEVELYHYSFVHWENYVGYNNLFYATPAGPYYQGFLMYRYQQNKCSPNLPWEAGYFVLKNGVLFCSDSKESKEIKFFVQLCVPHCKGCRRLPSADRPHVFELIVSNNDSLQLAAADDFDASVWLQYFLQTVCQAGHFLDTEPTYQTCCIVLANNSIFTLQQKKYDRYYKLLGCANVSDLLNVYTENDLELCCILEFESGEAAKCSGEWILFFGSTDERGRFLHDLYDRWKALHSGELPTFPIKDLSLSEKCKEMSHKLIKERFSLNNLFQDD